MSQGHDWVQHSPNKMQWTCSRCGSLYSQMPSFSHRLSAQPEPDTKIPLKNDALVGDQLYDCEDIVILKVMLA